MAEVLEGEQVGVAIRSFDAVSRSVALQQLLQLVASSATSARCVTAAQRHFSLDEGVRLYEQIYRKLS